MTPESIYFTRTELDRCANMRDQKQRLKQLKKFKTCHYVPVYLGNHLYLKDQENLGTVKLLTQKVRVPTPEEIAHNPSSRSAKLRAAIRVRT